MLNELPYKSIEFIQDHRDRSIVSSLERFSSESIKRGIKARSNDFQLDDYIGSLANFPSSRSSLFRSHSATLTDDVTASSDGLCKLLLFEHLRFVLCATFSISRDLQRCFD